MWITNTQNEEIIRMSVTDVLGAFMKFSKRINITLLVFLVVFNIIMRVPVTLRETGADTFMNHLLANSITESGHANWIINPLSFFGLYPLSYSSGALFSFSAFEQSSNVGTEYNILVISIILGIVGAFTSYILAKEFLDDDLFAFSVAILFSTSRIFLNWTTMKLNARGFFISILPLLLYFLLKSYKNGTLTNQQKSYTILIGIVFITLATIHRMFFFTSIIFFSFLISILIYKFLNRFKLSRYIAVGYSVVFIILFMSQIFNLSFYAPDFESLSHGYFFQGTEPYVIFLNLGIEYAMASGILIILLPLGFAALVYNVYREKLDQKHLFLLLMTLFFSPFMMDARYMRVFLMLIISLLIGFGIIELRYLFNKKLNENTTVIILVSILLISAIIPMFITIRPTYNEAGNPNELRSQTYNAGIFMKNYCEGSFTGNDPLLNRMVGVISGKLIPPLLNTEFFNESKIYTRNPFKNVQKTHGNPFVVEDRIIGGTYYEGRYIYYIKKHTFDDSLGEQLQKFMQIRYVLINQHTPINTPFFESVNEKKNKLYDDGYETIFGVLNE